ncbi:glycosyltransferase [Vibrio chagasii]|uniref:Glycosyltransferase n=1 Tax=Vibrio chagasii TaxID=170679 RepID=A0A7V7NPD5_9VIBR|nr:glycosyltransferase [Vibrio chagasii]KAB0466169.1 glycosyltransferase [Vibrio chagasii]
MKLSVVIPTYNRSQLLSYTLTSLVSQSNSNFEVIVVDDGGSDDSRQVCEIFKDKLNLRYIWQKDDGFRAGKARNLGLYAAEGDYIVFIDTGVLLQKDAIDKHIEIHENSKFPTVCIGYVYGFEISNEKLEEIEPHLKDKNTEQLISMMEDLNALDIRQSLYDEFGYNISSWPAPFDLFWTCHVSAEREELIKSGAFDESFNSWGGEDVDLGIRLFMNNNKFVVDRGLCSVHWPHEKEVSDKAAEANNAALRIHDKYNIWQTSFYSVPIEDKIFSLNKSIFLNAEHM